ncbi:ribosome-associated translation inhibitor RaiA [Corallococcus exiguus]|uniref:Ribosome hibernation promoting factor n=1 Tax=Corallococcus exiguus TaxID=83462 RepID=A0A7Y1RY81_9BACT|nr:MULTISPECIES: ribosome-associated translation inhibitor RaiA [Corallococcus]NBC39075.1 ribosome-associated translation inhibitor RaiA [Corallococcus exiguus]NNB85183.1 ribosome-associated translation inhibitor RaiA [Corallococcus exiguus]NNB94037.1 ribosome-associated translation inhibitor RaiA [Corallococcus exiguus]NNC01983.1 ribosome-associated translation inhibitor RaiA [Corallococcus exiguus]NNC14646.1 ribosome-associated translation inhibitor RaiA [Corallococcus exiguus]
MQLNITFRQFGASDSLKEYAREKVDRVNRLLDRAGEAHVVLSLERHLHHADITIHSGAWVLRGREKSDDMYASIDLAMDKIERQLRRYRDKLKSHHGKEKVHHRQDLVRVRHDVFEVHEPEATAEASTPAAQAAPAAQAPVAESGVARLVRTTHLAIQSLSVDDAVMQMNLMNNDFYVFQNQQSQALSIVYRRKEGGFGLIEPHLPDAPVAATGT